MNRGRDFTQGRILRIIFAHPTIHVVFPDRTAQGVKLFIQRKDLLLSDPQLVIHVPVFFTVQKIAEIGMVNDGAAPVVFPKQGF